MRTRILAMLLSTVFVSVPFATSASANVLLEISNKKGPGYDALKALDKSFDQTVLKKAQEVVRKNPNDAAARVLLARALLKDRKGAAAQTELEQAVNLGFPEPKIEHLIAESLFLQGQYRQALSRLKQKIIAPEFVGFASNIRGRVFAALNRPKDAEREMKKAVEFDPKNQDYWIDLAFLKLVEGRPDEGRIDIDKALSIDPTSVRSLIAKGDFEKNTTPGRAGYEKAQVYYTRALEIAPTNHTALIAHGLAMYGLNEEDKVKSDIKALRQLDAQDPFANFLEAGLAANHKDFRKAETLLQNNGDILDFYPAALLLKAYVSSSLQNFGGAEQALSQLLAIFPESMSIRNMLAAVQKSSGFPRAALKTMEEAPGDVENPVSDVIYASIYNALGDFGRADGFLKKAEEKGQDTSVVKLENVFADLSQNRLDKAERAINQLKQNPGAVEPKSIAILDTVLKTKRALANNDLKKATAVAEKLIEEYPNDPNGYSLRGSLRLQQKDFKGADADFQKSIKVQPDFTSGYLKLASSLVRQGRILEARSQYLKILDYDKSNVAALESLADIARRRQLVQEYVDWIKRLANAQPDNVDTRLRLVQAYIVANNQQEAYKSALAVRGAFPGNKRVLEALGSIYLDMGRPREAERALSAAALRDPDAIALQVRYAEALADQKKYEKAISFLKSKIAEVKEKKRAMPGIYYIALMKFEAMRGDYPGVVQLANTYNAENPKSNVAELALGDIYQRVDSIDKAGEAFEKAYRIRPNFAAFTRLEDFYRRNGQLPKALALVKERQKQDPEDYRLYRFLGDAYSLGGEWTKAVAAYEKMRDLGKGRDVASINNLALAYFHANNKKALPYALAALQLTPKNPYIQDTVGFIMAHRPDTLLRGIDLLWEASKNAPDNPDIQYHLAFALAKNNQTADARAALKKALETPKFESRKQAEALLATLP